jgi:magnesium-transporting ATPase (P-type)
VDKTIEAFQKANIKVWVLTGDKIDSSVNIAMSCNLISSHMQRFIIEEMDYNSLVQELDSIYDVLTKKSQLNSSNKM